jgi:uncharacterized protein with HEPN domain
MARKLAPILADILTAITGIETAVTNMTFEELEKNWVVNHAVQRALEIISEASRRIPSEIKLTQPSIRWASIAGIGNVLRHDYNEISNEIIWKVVRQELPLLKKAIETMATTLGE